VEANSFAKAFQATFGEDQLNSEAMQEIDDASDWNNGFIFLPNESAQR